MFCLYCGNKLPDGAIFCNRCGRRQNRSANPSNPSMTNVPTGRQQSSGRTMPFVQGPLPSNNAPTSQGTPSLQGSPPREESLSPWPAQPAFPTVLPQRNAGFITAGIGGIVGLLSFFFMPYISYGFITATGQQLTSLGYQAATQYGYSSSQPQFNGLLLLWLLPIVAGIIVLIAGAQLFRIEGAGKKAAAGWLIGLAVLAILGLLVAYIYLTAQIQNSTSSSVTLTSVIGSGVWIYIAAMIAIIVGGVIQTRSSQ